MKKREITKPYKGSNMRLIQWIERLYHNALVHLGIRKTPLIWSRRLQQKFYDTTVSGVIAKQTTKGE